MVTVLPIHILAISFGKMALELSYLELTSSEENCYDAFVIRARTSAQEEAMILCMSTRTTG